MSAKCTPEGFCSALSERIGERGKKGLVRLDTFSFTTMKESLLGIAYCTSPSDRGLLLNVCPWCAERIDWAFNAEKVRAS